MILLTYLLFIVAPPKLPSLLVCCFWLLIVVFKEMILLTCLLLSYLHENCLHCWSAVSESLPSSVILYCGWLNEEIPESWYIDWLKKGYWNTDWMKSYRNTRWMKNKKCGKASTAFSNVINCCNKIRKKRYLHPKIPYCQCKQNGNFSQQTDFRGRDLPKAST